jgi:hypothetical protein
MATAIWYPEKGDPVEFKDGSVGAVVEVLHISANLDSWIVKTRKRGVDGPMTDVVYSSRNSTWEEVE